MRKSILFLLLFLSVAFVSAQDQLSKWEKGI